MRTTRQGLHVDAQTSSTGKEALRRAVHKDPAGSSQETAPVINPAAAVSEKHLTVINRGHQTTFLLPGGRGGSAWDGTNGGEHVSVLLMLYRRQGA